MPLKAPEQLPNWPCGEIPFSQTAVSKVKLHREPQLIAKHVWNFENLQFQSKNLRSTNFDKVDLEVNSFRPQQNPQDFVRVLVSDRDITCTATLPRWHANTQAGLCYAHTYLCLVYSSTQTLWTTLLQNITLSFLCWWTSTSWSSSTHRGIVRFGGIWLNV